MTTTTARLLARMIHDGLKQWTDIPEADRKLVQEAYMKLYGEEAG